MSEAEPTYNVQNALVPAEERTVVFYDDEIKGGVVMASPSDRVVYVPVGPLCGFLGIDATAQRRRIQRDPVLSAEARAVVINTEGGPQEMTSLPLDMLNGWLFGINASRVKEEVRERLIRYQRECYRVLSEAFQEPLAPTSDPLAQVESLGRALITLAQEQRQFDRRLGTTEDDVDDLKRRVVALEEDAGPSEVVTDAQAAQISQAVKAVAMALGKQTGRNEYGGVYGELYRRFEVTSYKLLPAERFREAMEWLTDWHQSLTGEAPF